MKTCPHFSSLQKFSNYFRCLFYTLLFYCSINATFAQLQEYVFNGNLNEYNSGPALTEILGCGALPGSFGTQTAGTTAGACLTSNTFCFNDGGGLQYPNPGIISSSYTINIFFRFNSLAGYGRVIDFSNGAADAGVYLLNNCLNLYPNGNVGACPYFNTNTYYLITFVRDGNTNIISVYVDGALFGTYNDSGNIYRPPTSNTPIFFFKDDNTVPCEAQPGCVKYISITPLVASASDVLLLWNNITTVIHATPVAPPVVSIAPTTGLTCTSSSASLTASSTGTMVWNGGSLANAPNPASVTAGGTYTVTASDANGCIDTAMITVVANTTPPTVSAISSGNLTCSAPTATLTGTSAGNTMVWNGGALTNASNPANVSTAGTYTVTATNATNGCTNTATVSISSNTTIPTVSAISSDSLSCTVSTVTLTGTSAGNTMVWNGGALVNASNPATVSAVDTYTVTATDAINGCTNTATVTVLSSSNPPTVSAISSGNLTCSTTAVTLTGTSAGNTMVWDGVTLVNASNPATVSTAGTYTVTATDNNGCSNTATVTVTSNTTPPVVVAMSSDSLSCSLATVSITATSVGNTMVWNGGTLVNASNPATVSTAGTYTVTATDASNGCTNTAPVNVIYDSSQQLIVNVNSPTICSGATTMLVASGTNSYTWSTGAITDSISVSPLLNTSYTVTGTNGICSDTAISMVTVIPPVGVTVNSPTICSGDSVVLTAGGANSYVWSTGATTASITVSPVSPTSYSVTGTVNFCSTLVVSTVTVIQPPNLVLNTSTTTICSGTNAVLVAGGATAYLWSNGAANDSIFVSPLNDTLYEVIGTTNGCSDTAMVQVTVNPSPTITVNNSTICAGDTAMLIVSGATTYVWSTNSNNDTLLLTPLLPTTYTVVGTSMGCVDTAIATVQVNPLPIIQVTTDSICLGTVGTLIASGADTFVWSNATSGNQLNDSPVISTTYTVTGTTLGCTNTATGTITVNPYLSVNLSASDTICPGTSITLSALAQDGTGGPYTYTWAPAITQSSSTITVSPANTVTYTVTVDDGCSPAIIDSVTIHVLTSLQVSFTADVTSGCAPLCVNFSNTTSVFDDAIQSQNWSFGADQPTPQHCFNVAGVYDVSLTVNTAMGCMYTYTDSTLITVYQLPMANFTISNSNLIPNSSIDFIDNSSNAQSWNWNFGDTFSVGTDSFSTVQNPMHIYSDTGYYCVNLLVTGTGGCVDSIQNCLTIEPEYLFYIPNAFTPNEDGVNDIFLCNAQNIQSFEMSIFDRWGGLLFYSDDVSKGWDGKNYLKEIEKSGVYIYKIQIVDNNKKKHKYYGNVTMIFGE